MMTQDTYAHAHPGGVCPYQDAGAVCPICRCCWDCNAGDCPCTGSCPNENCGCNRIFVVSDPATALLAAIFPIRASAASQPATTEGTNSE